ncbi:hypothetical protein G6514_004722 [Epicoccum nigrum]|nr:hypothetical protein G6514_004722 [Epicoccum nigrum]
MPWLKRTPQTPTNMSLPPSPTQSLATSEDLILSFPSPTPREPSSPIVPNPLTTKSITFPLPTKPCSSTLAASRLGGPSSSTSRWLFRSPPVRAMTAPVKDELGDHFTRTALPSYQETQGRARRRREASQRRVEGMRGWLASTVGEKEKQKQQQREKEKEKATRGESRGTQTLERMHQRYDSGSHEHGAGGFLEHNDAFAATGDANPPLPSLNEDVLWFSLFRLRRRGGGGGGCMGCGEAHADVLSDRGAVMWVLHGCGHRVDDGCLDKLRERGVGKNAVGCHGCRHLGVQLGEFGEGEWRVRRRRLVDATGDVA